jgi:lipid II:glycine glycyltransferase (peptidoglycan interpeptide bridge formation enzyme)
LGSQGALVIQEFDLQEDALRRGEVPVSGVWLSAKKSSATIHRGDLVEEYEGVGGNYATFYTLMKKSIEVGTPVPVSLEDAQRVAEIIESARAISVR